MYKWPLGRLIRIACLLLTALVALDVGWNGAYAQLAVNQNKSQFILGIFFTVLTAAILIGGLIAIGFHKASVDFLIEVEQEMTKVEWPPFKSLLRSTIIIAVAIVVMATLILGVDTLNFKVLEKIQELGGKL